MLSSGNKQPMPTPFPPISMVPTAQMPQEIFPSSAQPEENQEKTLKKICKGKGKNEYPPLLKRGDQGQYESMTKRVEKVRLSDLKPVLEELHAIMFHHRPERHRRNQQLLEKTIHWICASSKKLQKDLCDLQGLKTRAHR